MDDPYNMQTNQQRKDQNVFEDDLISAKDVFAIEVEALTALSQSLDESFSQALDYLESCEGRVVITGMGKSGHIARKMAATFASTGTPALFIHPAEAGHGDLGMISSKDVVIALSNSGESSELHSVVHYARRFAIPLIAVTQRPKSTLAEAADTKLIIPTIREACPMNLAPTTSTTMMLALGDALAIALLKRRGFSSNDYHILHPSGQLGRQLMRVCDLMHKIEELPLISQDSTMADAIVAMTAKRFGCVGVLNNEKQLCGIVTDGDLRRHMSDHLMLESVSSVMTQNPITIKERALVADALSIMEQKSITVLFVVSEQSQTPVGLIQIYDCLKDQKGS